MCFATNVLNLLVLLVIEKVMMSCKFYRMSVKKHLYHWSV